MPEGNRIAELEAKVSALEREKIIKDIQFSHPEFADDGSHSLEVLKGISIGLGLKAKKTELEPAVQEFGKPLDETKVYAGFKVSFEEYQENGGNQA